MSAEPGSPPSFRWNWRVAAGMVLAAVLICAAVCIVDRLSPRNRYPAGAVERAGP